MDRRLFLSSSAATLATAALPKPSSAANDPDTGALVFRDDKGNTVHQLSIPNWSRIEKTVDLDTSACPHWRSATLVSPTGECNGVLTLSGNFTMGEILPLKISVTRLEGRVGLVPRVSDSLRVPPQTDVGTTVVNNPTHTSIHEAFDALRAFVKANPGTTVINADSPSPPHLGWSAWTTDPNGQEVSLYVSCPVTAVKDTPEEIRDYFRSADGRLKLAEWLQNGSA